MSFYRCQKDIFGYCLKNNIKLSEIETKIFALYTKQPYPTEEIEQLTIERDKLLKCKNKPESCSDYRTVSQYYRDMLEQLHKPDVKTIKHKIVVEPGGQGKSETKKALKRY